MEKLYELILQMGQSIYAEGAVFEVLCLLGVLTFTLLTIRSSRMTKAILKKAQKNFAEAERIRQRL